MTDSKSRIRNFLSPAAPTRAGIYLSIIICTAILFSYGCSREPVEFKSDRTNQSQSEMPENQGRQPEPAQLPDSAGNPNNTTGEDNFTNRSAENLPAPGRVERQPLVIPGGRRLTVRLLETLSSRTASPGQSFAAELASPVVINGEAVLPSRTPLRGRVVSARPSGRLKSPGHLSLTLESMRMPDGRWVNIDTTSVSAKGKSHKKRNIALIGGGSGVGAVIGAIAGGGKGAAIGAAAGAGAGTAGAYATGKKDVTFPAERRLSFSTTREIVISG